MNLQDLPTATVNILIVTSLSGGLVYALTPTSRWLPSPVKTALRILWRLVIWILVGFVLPLLSLIAVLTLLLISRDTGNAGAYWALIVVTFWVCGSVALVNQGNSKRVVPYLFAATGMVYAFLPALAFLASVTGSIGAPLVVAAYPILAAYIATVGLILKKLLKPGGTSAVGPASPAA